MCILFTYEHNIQTYKHAVIDPLLHKLRTQQSYKSATNPDRIAVLSPDMKRVRLQQQELAAQRAIEAEEERKQKAKEAKERKRVKTPEEERWEKLGGEGSKLGESSGSATDKGDSAGLRRRR